MHTGPGQNFYIQIMILYVNGDSHSAGSELVHIKGRYLIARETDDDDWQVIGESRGRDPHPECVQRSYGKLLADRIGAKFVCDAVSASSNDRILRTTREYLKHNRPDSIIIGWSTWEREEWFHEGTQQWWQINGGGVGFDWPTEFKERYKQYVLKIDHKKSMEIAHTQIWQLHQELDQLDIPHLFFNTYSWFDKEDHLDWEGHYFEPYSKQFTYFEWLRLRGFQRVTPDSYHYGPDAHRAWADFLYQNYFNK